MTRRRTAGALALIWVVVSLFLGVTETRRIVGLDEGLAQPVQHLVTFTILGALCVLAIDASPYKIVVGLGVAGVLGELVQLTTPDRRFELADIVMDLVGVVIGVTLGRSASRNGTLRLVVFGSTVALIALAPLALVTITGPSTYFADSCGPPPGPREDTPAVVLASPDLAGTPLPISVTEPSVEEIRARLLAADEFTLEAWFSTTDLAQTGPARVFTISDGINSTDVNVHLGVEGDGLSVRLRTSCELFNWIEIDDVLIADRAHHVAVSWSSGVVETWVDGRSVDRTVIEYGDLARWDSSFETVIGDEVGGERPFDGTVFSVTLWAGVLSADTIVARSRDRPDEPLATTRSGDDPHHDETTPATDN